MYEKIKKWFQQGFWKNEQVKQAVEKEIITEIQYKEILGDD